MAQRENVPREPASANRLVSVNLDDRSIAVASLDAEHERKVAIYDLIADNSFAVIGEDQGPYHLALSIAESRLIFEIFNSREERCSTVGLSLSPFRRIIKDYFLICDSYYKAIKTATPSQIETIDMARRSLHNDGSELLKERLKGKVEMDFDTARRIFTLVCALHRRG
jgi:uncharacterized protein (UPF0262 family)